MNAHATKPRVDLDATVERLRLAGLAHAAERRDEAAADESAAYARSCACPPFPPGRRWRP